MAGIPLVAISVGAFAVLSRGGGDAPRELSIAVLSFANGSDDPANEYLSDGITDAIQSRLNRLGDLWVTSRTSAMSYKGSNKQLRVIGEELGVAYVVEGSVRRTGSRLRIRITSTYLIARQTAYLSTQAATVTRNVTPRR